MEKIEYEQQELKRLQSIEWLNSENIFVCSGGIDIVPIWGDTKYKISPWAFEDPQWYISWDWMWGKARALAAIHINKYFFLKNRVFHTDTHQVQPKENILWITHSEIYANYLKKRWLTNIKEHKDIWIKNTFTQIVNVLKTMIEENLENICIITNHYHIPRMKAILDILLYNNTNIENDFIKQNGGIRNTIVNNFRKYNWFDVYDIISIEDIKKLLNIWVKIHIVSEEEILQYTPYNRIIQLAKDEIINIYNAEGEYQSKNKWNIRDDNEKRWVNMLYNWTYYISKEDKDEYFNS